MGTVQKSGRYRDEVDAIHVCGLCKTYLNLILRGFACVLAQSKVAC